MRIWDILKRALCKKFVFGLNDEKIQEKILWLEEVFKMALAMELATADVVHIKNEDMEDLHKMCTTKQNSAEIKKGKSFYFGYGGKWHESTVCRMGKKKDPFLKQCKPLRVGLKSSRQFGNSIIMCLSPILNISAINNRSVTSNAINGPAAPVSSGPSASRFICQSHHRNRR